MQEVVEPRRATREPVTRAASYWQAADLRSDESWIRHFTPAELSELYFAASDLHGRSLAQAHIDKAQFPLPFFGFKINRIRDELDFGRGITLLRGLNVHDYSSDLLTTLCIGLGSHLGLVAPQNLDGHLTRAVVDSSSGQHADAFQARGHRGRAEMLPHSDSADVVGLLCVRPAKQGGGTTICSSMAIYTELAYAHPEYLNALCAGFFFDMTGKTVRGISDGRLPVFNHHRDRISCQFNKTRIEVGMKKAGVPLGEVEIAALRCMTELALRPDIAFHFDLYAGDLLLLNNHVTLHARNEYEDWPEPDRKRLLLRFWVNVSKHLDESQSQDG